MYLKRKIYFYYPEEKIGGTEMLFARMAEYYISNSYEVIVLEYENDSFISKYLKDKKLQFIQVKNELIIVEGLLILTAFYLHIFEKKIKLCDGVNLIFLDLHPYCLIDNTVFSYFYKNKKFKKFSNILKRIEHKNIKYINKFLEISIDKKAFFFMCLSNFLFNKSFFYIKSSPIYFPISLPINQSNIKKHYKNPQKNKIKILWISRPDKDKVDILKLLIEDIIHFNSSQEYKKIELHVISNHSIKKYLTEEEAECCHIIGEVFGENLDQYIQNNIDFGISIGTASLEIGKNGVPVAITTGTDCLEIYRNEKKRYMWLYESEGYDVSVTDYYQNKTKSLNELVNEYFLNFEKISDITAEYLNSMHSNRRIMENFVTIIQNSSFIYKDFRNLKNRYYSTELKLLFNLKKISKYLLN